MPSRLIKKDKKNMERKFCTALCLILALLFFTGCGFINFSFETTEPQTTETEITTKITDDFDFAVEDVPKLPPDPLGIRELKYEEMPTFDNLNALSEYILWCLMNENMLIECYISKDFAKNRSEGTNILETAFGNAFTYYLFAGFEAFEFYVDDNDEEKDLYARIKLYYPQWEKDLEAKAEALEYIAKNPVPENGFQSFIEEQRYAKRIHDFIAKKVMYSPLGYEEDGLQGDDSYENMQEAWNVLAEENTEAVCAGYARAFALICQYAGIDCSYVIGNEEENIGHAWNIIYPTDGSDPVIVDVTWDDNFSVDNKSQNHVAKAFFYCYSDVDRYHFPDKNMFDFIEYLHK